MAKTRTSKKCPTLPTNWPAVVVAYQSHASRILDTGDKQLADHIDHDHSRRPQMILADKNWRAGNDDCCMVLALNIGCIKSNTNINLKSFSSISRQPTFSYRP